MAQMSDIPHGFLTQLHSYIQNREMPGPFLLAILQNDLRKAVVHISPHLSKHIGPIAQWLYWEAPGLCWGSPERVESWLKGEGKDAQT